MEVLAFALICIGGLISIVYGFLLLIAACRVSVLWGLGYFFVPFVSLIFVIVHWGEAKDPFLKGLLSIPFIVVGLLLMPGVQ